MPQYADDLTLLLSAMNSINEVFSLQDICGEYSHLKINKECYLDHGERDLFHPKNITWTNESIKLLGIYGNSSNETVMANFHSKVEALLR